LIEQGLTPDGSNSGLMLFDDFVSFPNLTVTTAAAQLQPPNGYFAYINAQTTVGAVRPHATDPSVLQLLTATAAAAGDNSQTSIGTGGNRGVLGSISNVAGSDKLLIFESRIRLNSITDGDGSVFVGLGEEALGQAATPLADATGHALASKDLIGFAITEDNNDALTFRYRVAGAAEQTVLTYGTALEANVWYNVGFVYDPGAPASQKIKIFVDNVEQSTYVTADSIALSTFPNSQKLAMYASIINSANNDPQQFDMDFWAFHQAG